MKKIIIFSELSLFNLFLALVCRIFKYNVVYLQKSGKLENLICASILEKIKITAVDYSKFRYYDTKSHYSTNIVMARNIYKKIFNNEIERSFGLLFNNIENVENKLKIASLSLFYTVMGEMTADTYICAKYFTRFYDKTYIYSKSNVLFKIALKDDDSIKYFHFPAIDYLRFFLQILSVIGVFINNKMAGFFRYEKAKQSEQTKKDYSQYEVLFFPHKGVSYSNLFLKNHYYMDDPASPFNEKNILHIEFPGITPEEYHDIISYYKKNNIQYTFFDGIRANILFKSSFVYIRLMFPQILKDIFKRYGLVKHILQFLIYASYCQKLNFILKFKNAKIALVGYDFMFPQLLSVALSSLNIAVVSVQERFIQPFYDRFIAIFDYYFVCGPIVKEHLQLSDVSCIHHIDPIGPIRLDLLFDTTKLSRDERYKQIKKQYKVIIAFDYHSEKDNNKGNSSPFINWKNNKAFYKDLIRLAVTFPDQYIVIRGKYDTWCSIPEFSDIFEMICNIPNMEINRDYSQLDISYRLLSYADLVIAKHTSIADEALAAKIPVLFYDYMPNAVEVISSFFDYEKYPVYVHSYEELQHRVDQILNNGLFMDEEQFTQMRKRFYNDSFDGKVKERLHNHLMRIYNNFANKKSPKCGSKFDAARCKLYSTESGGGIENL